MSLNIIITPWQKQSLLLQTSSVLDYKGILVYHKEKVNDLYVLSTHIIKGGESEEISITDDLPEPVTDYLSGNPELGYIDYRTFSSHNIHKFSKEKILSILEKECEEIDKLFEKNPNYAGVLVYPTNNMGIYSKNDSDKFLIDRLSLGFSLRWMDV